MDKMKQFSLKSKLLQWLIPLLAIIILIAFIGTWYIVSREINQYFDNLLHEASKNIEQKLSVANGTLVYKNPNTRLNIQTSHGKNSFFYTVLDAKGKVLTGYDNMPKPKQNNKAKIFYNSNYTHQPIRALLSHYELYRNNTLYKADIIVAETLEDRNEILKKFMLIFFLFVTAISIFSVLAILLAIEKGLYSLKKIEKTISKRDIYDLEPIVQNVPKEIQSLIDNLNNLFQRVHKSFLQVANFSTDVSHQLKTPLAELKILLQTDDNRIKNENIKYIKIIDSMSRTIKQLILYTKTNPNSIEHIYLKKIDLTKLCKSFCMQKAPIIYLKNAEFIFSAKNPYYIKADKIMIKNILDNLIDNSLIHNKKLQKTIQIELSIKKLQNRVFLIIQDNGIGIKKQYLNQITKRFF